MIESKLESSEACMTFDWQDLARAAEIEYFTETSAEEIGCLNLSYVLPVPISSLQRRGWRAAQSDPQTA
jgi:hypothetical protein